MGSIGCGCGECGSELSLDVSLGVGVGVGVRCVWIGWSVSVCLNLELNETFLYISTPTCTLDPALIGTVFVFGTDSPDLSMIGIPVGAAFLGIFCEF